jgi:antitoxin MazE
MTAIISKWGNSQGLRLPKSVVKDLDLSIGDELKIITKDNKVILEPIVKKKKKYNIYDLVKKVPKDYKPKEEFENKMGIEEW